MTLTNWGMATDPASKTAAEGLCHDARDYIADTCNNGISGTDGTTPAHPRFQFEAAKGGTVVWNDLEEKKQIEFNVGLKKN